MRISQGMKKSTTLALAATASAAALAYALIPKTSRVRAGQVVLVTGGSRGLGLAIARRFAQAGCKLVLAARKADELELARDGILRDRLLTDEDDILLVEADLNDQDQVGSMIDAAIRAFGRLDILINNAGIIEVGPVEDQGLDAYEKAMQTNFFAALYGVQAVLPHMLERGSGAIVNISSIGGKFAVPHMLPYSASKFALAGYSAGLHAELRMKGIRVTTVCPGLLRTGGEAHAKFVGNVDAEKAWFMWAAKTPGIAVSAEHAANKIFSAVDSGRAEIEISPQAWLAARINGLMPETTSFVSSLVNQYLLPGPVHSVPQAMPAHDHDMPEEPASPDSSAEVADPSPS